METGNSDDSQVPSLVSLTEAGLPLMAIHAKIVYPEGAAVRTTRKEGEPISLGQEPLFQKKPASLPPGRSASRGHAAELGLGATMSLADSW